ncbi:MAG: SDR family oxidoreductase [Acidobacteriota bacterium]
MTRSLEGRRCLVTGGSRGLGRAIAVAFAENGARVAIASRGSSAGSGAAAPTLGPEARPFQGDVSDAAFAERTVRALEASWGGIDVLVNAAGVTHVLPVALLEKAEWDEAMATNLEGAFVWSRAALRPMIRARGGSIVNIGIFSSERLVEAPIHFAAAKSGLRGLTESMAREVGRYGVRVNLIAPGLLDEGLGRQLPQHRVDEYVAQCALGRLGGAREIAEMAVFLASGDASLVTGAKIAIDGGL